LNTLFFAPLLGAAFCGSFAQAQSNDLRTRDGFEAALTLSHYRYEEPSLAVKLEGYKIGVDAAMSTRLRNDWLLRLEGRYANGDVDYTGSGEKDNNPDWYAEVRALFGRDFLRDTYSLTPFIGIGYRHLYNDIRGTTSTGAVGYTRTSQYTYMPLGVTHRIRVQSKARVATTLEADYLIQGRQTSTLSDADPALSDITNDQRNGYGFRGSVFYENEKWIVGPWFHYWKAHRSDVVPLLATAGGATFIVGSAWEPENKATEIGLRLGYRF
jgi:hypothetical protein